MSLHSQSQFPEQLEFLEFLQALIVKTIPFITKSVRVASVIPTMIIGLSGADDVLHTTANVFMLFLFEFF
jgi:hypothetical protein